MATGRFDYLERDRLILFSGGTDMFGPPVRVVLTLSLALSQVDDVRSVIPKFVRKDIALVDFPKAAWVLNDAYRKMHNEKTP